MSTESQTSIDRIQREVFLAALERLDPKERSDYLDAACATNAELRRGVEHLLDEVPGLGNFLEEPALVEARERPPKFEDDPSTVPLSERPGDYIGNYKLGQKLGEGGCGVVYLAKQEQPFRRDVALKIIKLGMDTRQVIARFEA